MTERPSRRVPAQFLLCLPLCASIGAGIAKLSHCSDLTVLIVTVAPCADCAVLYCLVVAVYRAEVRRYLNAGPQGRRAIRESTPHGLSRSSQFSPSSGNPRPPRRATDQHQVRRCRRQDSP